MNTEGEARARWRCGMSREGSFEVVEEGAERLDDYARVPIAFPVTEVFDATAIEMLGRGEDAAATRLSKPYLKDYDTSPGGRPTDWPARFDTTGWVFLAAYVDGRRVGGAAVVTGDRSVNLLSDQPDVALLWDIRVAPDVRQKGIGTMLLATAERVAERRGAIRLRVETQQVNVPACRLYQRRGFALTQVLSHAYPELPHEVQLLWTKPLVSSSHHRD